MGPLTRYDTYRRVDLPDVAIRSRQLRESRYFDCSPLAVLLHAAYDFPVGSFLSTSIFMRANNEPEHHALSKLS